VIPAALLQLADGRFPMGTTAHSGGIEAAVADGRVHDVASLQTFTHDRLVTIGLVQAALAVAAWRQPDELSRLDAEADARLPSPPLRRASRRLGRQLARVAGRCWPHPVLGALAADFPGGAHQPLVWGVTGIAAGLGGPEVAAVVVHHVVQEPCSAGVRLLGLDPFAVAGLAAGLGPLAATIASDACVAAAGPPELLPACATPLLDLASLEHEVRPIRMFAT
jgi:urease accessory protein